MVFHTASITVSSINLNQLHTSTLHQNRPWFRQLNPGLRVIFSVFEKLKISKAWIGTQWHNKTSPVFLCLKFLAGSDQESRLITQQTLGCILVHLWKAEEDGTWLFLESPQIQWKLAQNWNYRTHYPLHLLSSFPDLLTSLNHTRKGESLRSTLHFHPSFSEPAAKKQPFDGTSSLLLKTSYKDWKSSLALHSVSCSCTLHTGTWNPVFPSSFSTAWLPSCRYGRKNKPYCISILVNHKKSSQFNSEIKTPFYPF